MNDRELGAKEGFRIYDSIVSTMLKNSVEHNNAMIIVLRQRLDELISRDRKPDVTTDLVDPQSMQVAVLKTAIEDALELARMIASSEYLESTKNTLSEIMQNAIANNRVTKKQALAVANITRSYHQLVKGRKNARR